MTEQTKCPSCDATELEMRTDFRMMCPKCGYVFPEVEAHPDDETPTNVEMLLDEEMEPGQSGADKKGASDAEGA